MKSPNNKLQAICHVIGSTESSLLSNRPKTSGVPKAYNVKHESAFGAYKVRGGERDSLS
jgi:hypothetical protein